MTQDPSPKDPTPDQKAAHEFLTELRTRITLQPLAYQHGVEARALESLWEVFGQAREAMKKNPGCEQFASLATKMLNVELRPVTAKWHRAKEGGRLNSRDGGDEFRADLLELQERLKAGVESLYAMAYPDETATGEGKPQPDAPTKPALDLEVVKTCLKPLNYGIPRGMLLPEEEAGNDAAATRIREDLNRLEAEHVQARRGEMSALPTDEAPLPDDDPSQGPGENAAGLALSGGGIRSASFSLGVVQVLAERGLLEQMDFLSTVSGGGYTGSFLTSRLGAGASCADLGKPHGPDTAPIRALRQRAKFLTARSLWESWGMVAQTLAGTLINWLVPLLVLTVLALVPSLWKKCDGPEIAWGVFTAVLAVATLLGAFFYFAMLRKGAGSAAGPGWIFAITSMALAAAGFGWGIESLFRCIFVENGSLPVWKDWPQFGASLSNAGNRFTLWLAGMGGLATLVPIIARFVPVLKNPAVRKVVIKVALFVAGLVIPLLGVIVFLLLCAVGRVGTSDSAGWSGLMVLSIAALLLLAVALFVLNINFTGPHRLYRNGLDTAFVQESETGSRAPLLLTKVDPNKRAPYHLVNTAVNLPTSDKPGLRDRLCDFFLFSKYYCGAPVTGYAPTASWYMNGKPADLGTAMAISGAAASSSMGLGSMPSLRALLTFINVRLGFWIKRPSESDIEKKKGAGGQPGFSCLLREMTALGMTEKKRWLNLSDGGHIENMGVYELLRRRCKFIVCVDGECDPLFSFAGLMTMVRHAQIDFGVRIEPCVTSLQPHPDTGYSRTHSLFTRIHYPAAGGHAEGTGLLLYLKLSLTGNEPELINRYRRQHPEFPHQSTLDQFFDEEQFEAYRQLGVHAAEGLFSRALMHNPFHQSAAGQPVTAPPSTMSVRAWFTRLAANLLDP